MDNLVWKCQMFDYVGVSYNSFIHTGFVIQFSYAEDYRYLSNCEPFDKVAYNTRQ